MSAIAQRIVSIAMGSYLKLTSVLVAAVALSCLVGAAVPETKCARCGTVCPCKKMCRLVCEEKKVEVVCWGCKCEDFCVPGPGCPTCERCKCVCENCVEGKNPSGVCSEPKPFYWKIWQPSFAQMYTKTKLMRRAETVKVPTYKWVVENVCCDCAHGYVTCDSETTRAEPAIAPAAKPAK